MGWYVRLYLARWYVWLYFLWSVCTVIYFFQEKNYYAAFFCAAYYFMVFLFLHCMETIKKKLQKENGSEFENAVALYVFFLAVVAGNHFTAFWCVAFLFMFFVFDYCIEKMKKLEYYIEKMKNLVNEPQGSEFENAVAFEKLYKRHEDLILENFELRSDLSKKKLEIEELEKDKKILKSLLMNIMDPNSWLITILAENKDFLKMCDDLLIEGKEKYPNDDWKEISFSEHFEKAKGHLAKEIKGEISDHCSPHGVSALVRMIFGMINKYKK